MRRKINFLNEINEFVFLEELVFKLGLCCAVLGRVKRVIRVFNFFCFYVFSLVLVMLVV